MSAEIKQTLNCILLEKIGIYASIRLPRPYNDALARRILGGNRSRHFHGFNAFDSPALKGSIVQDKTKMVGMPSVKLKGSTWPEEGMLTQTLRNTSNEE
jgi:hypothetical protein